MPVAGSTHGPLVPLREGEAHLWYLFTEQLPGEEFFKGWQPQLSAREQARCARFRFPEDRLSFLAAHVLTRRALSRHAAVGPDAWVFEENEHGKPHVSLPRDQRHLRFNMTHTRGLVACLVTTGCEVGVDAEDTQRPVDHLRLARRFFSAEETRQLQNAPQAERADLFFDFWTLKEAYIKARGLGVFLVPLGGFSFRKPEGRAAEVRFSPEIQDDPAAWHFQRLRIGSRHTAAAAIRMPAAEELRLHQHNAAGLLDPTGTKR